MDLVTIELCPPPPPPPPMSDVGEEFKYTQYMHSEFSNMGLGGAAEGEIREEAEELVL